VRDIIVNPMPTGDISAAPCFAFFRLRFRFRAGDSIYFPEGKPGNIIRGAFGTLLRKLSCSTDCPGAKTCSRRAACPYARIFEPGSAAGGPSGLADWPRPFVFRALHLNGETIQPGGTFHFDVHLFDLRDPAIESFVRTFAELANAGLGPRRGRARLVSVDQIDGFGLPLVRLCDDGSPSTEEIEVKPSRVDLRAAASQVGRVRIEFLSPTELKHEHTLAPTPEFGILFARIRDRIGTLSALYGPGSLDIDFKGLGEQAAQIRMTKCDVRNIEVERRSSRTGQRHPIGGFTGFAEYEGELAEFLPYLNAAVYAGVGRQTTFGNGEIRMDSITAASGPAPAEHAASSAPNQRKR
jgi:hypothetical protein